MDALHKTVRDITSAAIDEKKKKNARFAEALELRRPECADRLFQAVLENLEDKVKAAAAEGLYACTVYEYDYPFKHQLSRESLNVSVDEFHTVYLMKGAQGEEPQWCVLKRLQQHLAPFEVYDVFQCYEKPNVIKVCWHA